MKESVVGRQELYIAQKQRTWWFHFGHSGFLAGSSVASLHGNSIFYNRQFIYTTSDKVYVKHRTNSGAKKKKLPNIQCKFLSEKV